MGKSLEIYKDIIGPEAIEQIREIARPLVGKKVVNVNSTKVGGGVAEILFNLVPLMQDLGIDASWEVITGEGLFFDATKSFHNGLQGNEVTLTPEMLEAYEETNRRTAEELRPILEDADFVVIHDPQPAPLLSLCPNRKGKWTWRCHIHAGNPHPPVWDYLSRFLKDYDASLFHMEEFIRPMPHKQVIMPPSIDPLSPKNMDLDPSEVAEIFPRFGLDPNLPLVVQVSRFDWFKDPLGVIEASRQARKTVDHQFVYAGGGATDDPEGMEVLAAVEAEARNDPRVHILMLPGDAHTTINAIQRAAAVVLQKSTKEGFGLTVSEAMWKSVPVIGGDVGGIRLQIEDGVNGYLVGSVEECADRIVELLSHPEKAAQMGQLARETVKSKFLITRHLKNYLELFVGLMD